MRILFDNGVPRGLAKLLVGHSVEEAREHGWDELANGFLIQAAEDAGFDLLLTNDNQIQYQQNLTARRIAIIVLTTSSRL
jgi:hypothetical protein